jgi:hypothetical protein
MCRSLVICGLCNYSGYGRHVTEIIRALNKLGISVKLIRPPEGDAPFVATVPAGDVW